MFPFERKGVKNSGFTKGNPTKKIDIRQVKLMLTTIICTLPTFFIPKTFKNIIKHKKPKATSFVRLSSMLIKTARYAPSPIKAKELFSSSDNQSPMPEIVPNKGPKARSI